MAKHTITIELNDEQERFVRNLLADDREKQVFKGMGYTYTIGTELRLFLMTELREYMDLHPELC